jgi:pSer/pThr/pTyr-binding forkhead associated (FHA) protein
MDVGLVCDQCDAFNAMAAASCISCGVGLTLHVPRRAASSAPSGTGRVPAIPGGTATGGTVAQADAERSQPKPSPSERICNQCGQPVQAGYRFCGNCGAPISAASSRRPAPGGERRTQYFGAMQAARAKLVLIKGDGLDGVSYTLAGQDHVAGRTEGPLLFQDDPFLSPRHANFYYKDGKLHVRDELSANGVYLRIRTPTALRSGDLFLVGEQVIRVEATPPETAGLGPDAEGTYVFASPRRASRMRLVQLLRGGDIGLCVRAAGEVVVLGRDGNDINFPDDPFISGRHAQVGIDGAGATPDDAGEGGSRWEPKWEIVLQDLGSKNGTFVRIRPGKDTPLVHGDYVFMGQQLLRVEIVG